MDTTRLGEVAAELMDHLAEEYPEHTLGEVLVLAALHTDEETTIQWRCSDDRCWVQDGLLYAALHGDDR